MAKKKTKRATATLLEYDHELSKQFSKGSKIKQCFNNCAELFLSPEKLNFPAERAFVWAEKSCGKRIPKFGGRGGALDGRGFLPDVVSAVATILS